MNNRTHKTSKAAAAKPRKRRGAKRRAPRPRGKAPTIVACQPPPEELYWLPQGHLWDEVPEPIRQAVRTVVVPAYERFVAQARDEMDRSIGMTLVHLVWLEVCQQTHMALGVANQRSIFSMALAEEEVPRYLDLVRVKAQTTEVLLKAQFARELLRQREPLRSLAAPVACLGEEPQDLPVGGALPDGL